MGKSFKKIHACAVGSFGDNTEKIPQWIKANGGVYSKEIDDSVTHLIATEAAVKKNVEAVRQAKRLKHIKIVTYDWLEDSLQSKTRRPKREGPYLWERILKEQKRKAARGSKVQKKSAVKKKQQQKQKQRGVDAAKSLEDFEKGARAIVSEMESYHKTGVTYSATLVRPSVIKNRKESTSPK
ncbi:hypothetical protein VTN77DRAFT_8871 [Rasamsonia byssochlamydoides]|uniref:uncharacterized protein n=1 Tax=Rasamsonia byssochlamydoides TaxID=89139 RepID=UPI003743584C